MYRVIFVLLFCGAISQAQQPTSSSQPAPVQAAIVWQPPLDYPARAYSGPELPQDTGAAEVWQDLLKLRITARLMHTAAHPDDEDGGMLTTESRGLGATVMMMTINRGEGGQNKFGPELFDELGILRTLELLAAGKYYGVEQRFTHVVDFGFSKNEEETFQKWGGHDVALGDIVRVIRTFRPDVLITRFQGSPRDGHGNHQASGTLTKEAFRAAADPNRFPEQIREGLLPWQAKKLYMDGFALGDNWTVHMNVGTYAPVLGQSYTQFAVEGLAHQISQGTGGARLTPGDRFVNYKLIDSVLPGGVKEDREQGFFDGIDTSLASLETRLGADAAKVPFLHNALADLDRDAQNAIAAFNPGDTSRAAEPLLAGVSVLDKLIPQIEASSLNAQQKLELLTNLREKREQFAKAANDALGIVLNVWVDPPGGQQQATGGFFRLEQTQLYVNPGQAFTCTARLYNRSHLTVTPSEIRLDLPRGWTSKPLSSDLHVLKTNEMAAVRFQVTVPANAEYTRPYFHRDDPQTESVYRIDDPRYATLPFAPPPVQAIARYTVDGSAASIRAVVQARYIDPIYGQQQRPLAVAPQVSVQLEPPTLVVNTRSPLAPLVSVSVRNNGTSAARGTLRLELPQGWRAEPAAHNINLTDDGETARYDFRVTASNLKEQHYRLRAIADIGGKQYAEGFRTVGRQDLGTYFYYTPARQDVSAVDVRLPPNLTVGYIMGAGDDIPQVLRNIGLNVQMITSQELATGDLSRFGTIVLGIRAYDVRTDVREQNRRLLQYVQNGGTLIVQYNQSVGIFNAGHYTPYAASEANERVTVEEAPVQILEPQNRIMQYPNAINAHDFDNWVQERGLYFMGNWAPEFTPLLASNDPGEQPLKGGLLVAKYGKGTYIYTGYAFFRQLPAGVPGAIRLFANLIAAGHVSTTQ